MRTINEIIIHCSATPAGRHITVDDIDRWHRRREFNQIGYHYVIYLDGTIHPGRPLELCGAHCLGHNANSIGICYVGGLDSHSRPCDTRTPRQRQALIQLLTTLKTKYPAATIHSHRDFAPKDCPCFDATKEYQKL